jgi:hypothetical protein
MNLIPDWKIVLKKAWSVRLMLLAGVLSAVEVVLPLFAYDLPRGVFAALSGVVVMSAFVARLMAQKDLS